LFTSEDFGKGGIAIRGANEIVAAQSSPYRMPEEPGWYQIDGFLNGTGFDGIHFSVELSSHYFYIRECSSEDEAREELGPPPSERNGDGDSTTPTPSR